MTNVVCIFMLLGLAFQIFSCTTYPHHQILNSTAHVPLAQQDPSQLYGELFKRAQTAPVFEDSKYFVDMIPREDPDLILYRFKKTNPRSREELRQFIDSNFFPTESSGVNYKSKPNVPIDLHIKKLWGVLKRNPNEEGHSAASLIPLPHSYVVPGGRFREIYYWDSYFTLLGLLADQEDTLFQDMVRNFEHLLLTTGRIPNGNRDYYRSRSQPPFFSHMVGLWQSKFGDESAVRFLPALKIEHDFWMSGERAVPIDEDGILNRYWDDRPEPRPEAYKEDVELAKRASSVFGRPAEETYRDLRAGAESGWDYSTRWFSDPREFATIETTNFVPIDLNSLLYHLEMKISELSARAKNEQIAEKFKKLAQKRQSLIGKYLWDEKSGSFRDFNWKKKALSDEMTVAMVVPLFVKVATNHQARLVAQNLAKHFLKSGGLVTSLRVSGQQWDAPNGWPPHQWMAYVGLKSYKEDTLAEQIKERWLKLNQKIFRSTGKMMEKYNVINLDLKSGGGEYPLQDGFGWTNGVYRAFSLGLDSQLR